MNDKIFLYTILPWYLLSIHNTLPTNLSDRHGKGFGMENVSTKLKTQGFAGTTCNSIFWNAGEVLRCELLWNHKINCILLDLRLVHPAQRCVSEYSNKQLLPVPVTDLVHHYARCRIHPGKYLYAQVSQQNSVRPHYKSMGLTVTVWIPHTMDPAIKRSHDASVNNA